MERQKTVLITGGSRGIGAQTARRFAQAGYRVAINYQKSKAEAEALAHELGGIAVQADVADFDQVQEMVDKVLHKFCQLDILVCNAGQNCQELLGDMTDQSWRRVMGVNLDGVFHCCRAVYPHFVRQHGGKIITVSSMWGQIGGSCEVAYSAAKAGVIGLTRGLAKELGPCGVTVNCVAPGVIATDMNRGLTQETLEGLAEDTPLLRLGTADDVAATILFLASEGGDFMTGQVLAPNGGFVIGG